MEDDGTHGTSIKLKSENGVVADLSGQVHLLPCSIKFDGPSSVSDYFKPKSTGMEVEGLRLEEAHFRGRKLQGTTLSLPEGYSGFVLGKKGLGKRKAPSISEGNSNCWEMNAKFKNITYWKHDSLPSQHDTFVRSFHWLAVAKAMHQPVGAEDLLSASIALEKMK
ncbi:Ribonuclease H2, subunit C [Trema orientale]|uniref:Ribonuclease H2, subunit C n=1 Tax=Trema orientale TaxID=63057 RepID=A0A2P5DMD3_TREOI|nr:Ribonuclease H2, subunit C [Trema orientale]